MGAINGHHGLLLMPTVPPVTYATWNPSDKASEIVLSSGNKTATRGAGSFYASVRANKTLSGKQYWEVSYSWSGSGSVGAVGIAQSGLALSSASDYAGNNSSDVGAWGPTAEVYKSNAIIATYGAASSGTFRFAFDAATGKLWIGTVASGWMTGNPATGTSPITTMAAGTYYPVCTICDASAVTANFGASAFSGSVPSGYSSGVS